MEHKVKMIDVSEKAVTLREARARAVIRLKKETLDAIRNGQIEKGDVLTVAKVAGINGAKKTWELLPMCHPISLSSVAIDIFFDDENTIRIESTARAEAKTGVEMEALVAVTSSALTVYDMCKSIDRGITIESIYLLEKKGGRSGHWKRKGQNNS
jgi:cyclic pyranopterin phosphate synthase